MQSDQVNELFAALAIAQGQIKNPTRNKTVTVTTRSGGTYKFSYADQAAVIDAVKKPLSENGLGYTQFVEMIRDGKDEGKFRLVTILGHKSGQWISTAYPLFLATEKDRDGNILPPSSQGFGSAQTFMKRYALAAICGIAADDDDDANVADGNTAKVQDGKPLRAGDVITTGGAGGTVPYTPTGGAAGTPGKPNIDPPTPAAAALTAIVTRDDRPIEHFIQPHEIVLGDSPDWIWFGQQLIEVAKQGQWPDWNEANRTNLARMENEAPKVYARMIAAINKLQEPQEPKRPRGRPRKETVPLTLKDDPENYLRWLDKSCQSAADYHAFVSSQADIIAAGLPPDQMAANDIIKKHAPQ